MTVLPFHPLAELFPLIEGEEFDELVADIKSNGLREPIVLDGGLVSGGQIVDGRNRYRACQASGVPARFEVLPRGTDFLAFVLSKNLHRRHLNESQRAMVAAKLANMPAHRPADKSANLQTSTDEAAARLSVSPRSVASAKKVREQGSPELVHAVEQGKLAVSAAEQAVKLAPAQQRQVAEHAEAGRANVVRTVIKKEARTVRERDLGTKQRALPDEKFGVIVADPEWHDENWSDDTGNDRHASNHYPTSSLEVIASRPVAQIAAKDCVLFLWTTNQHLRIAIGVMEAWGFEYKSNYCWGKDKIGLGRWNRSKHELFLIGTQGKPPCPAPGTQWDSLQLAPVGGEHSEKPDLFLEMIEEYFPTLPKIELNARRRRPGWEAWGLEAPEEIEPVSKADEFESRAEEEIGPDVPDVSPPRVEGAPVEKLLGGAPSSSSSDPKHATLTPEEREQLDRLAWLPPAKFALNESQFLKKFAATDRPYTELDRRYLAKLAAKHLEAQPA